MASPAKVQKEPLHWFSLSDEISKSDQAKIVKDAHCRYQSLTEVTISVIDEIDTTELPSKC